MEKQTQMCYFTKNRQIERERLVKELLDVYNMLLLFQTRFETVS